MENKTPAFTEDHIAQDIAYYSEKLVAAITESGRDLIRKQITLLVNADVICLATNI